MPRLASIRTTRSSPQPSGRQSAKTPYSPPEYVLSIDKNSIFKRQRKGGYVEAVFQPLLVILKGDALVKLCKIAYGFTVVFYGQFFYIGNHNFKSLMLVTGGFLKSSLKSSRQSSALAIFTSERSDISPVCSNLRIEPQLTPVRTASFFWVYFLALRAAFSRLTSSYIVPVSDCAGTKSDISKVFLIIVLIF